MKSAMSVMRKSIYVGLVLLVVFMLGTGDVIEGFGQGAQAQISSNRDDDVLFGSGSGSPKAANEYATSGYQSQQNSLLSPTTAQQYQQMTSRGSGNGWGSTGVPNFAGHAPGRSMNQPDFSPHIQKQFMRYERQLALERRKNRGVSGGHLGGGHLGGGLYDQLFNVLDQIFMFVLSVLNILIGWLF